MELDWVFILKTHIRYYGARVRVIDELSIYMVVDDFQNEIQDLSYLLTSSP